MTCVSQLSCPSLPCAWYYVTETSVTSDLPTSPRPAADRCSHSERIVSGNGLLGSKHNRDRFLQIRQNRTSSARPVLPRRRLLRWSGDSGCRMRTSPTRTETAPVRAFKFTPRRQSESSLAGSAVAVLSSLPCAWYYVTETSVTSDLPTSPRPAADRCSHSERIVSGNGLLGSKHNRGRFLQIGQNRTSSSRPWYLPRRRPPPAGAADSGCRIAHVANAHRNGSRSRL
ncbi:hypothetical protein SKAU_G00182000 [Synaphobranchus kaupii]|uniref:Uncharacterized protein n=1 Tax=Synaphobranchus kaupii TaxID=118154 RepID=A0A9Q1IW11_SYNKA|nr:hypothetical protein SKAU_G00182000 [Synaphobranchus kaupii]